MTSTFVFWIWQRDGSWKPVTAPIEQYRRIADLSAGPNGDATVSLVPMPIEQRQSA